MRPTRSEAASAGASSAAGSSTSAPSTAGALDSQAAPSASTTPSPIATQAVTRPRRRRTAAHGPAQRDAPRPAARAEHRARGRRSFCGYRMSAKPGTLASAAWSAVWRPSAATRKKSAPAAHARAPGTPADTASPPRARATAPRYTQSSSGARPSKRTSRATGARGAPATRRGTRRSPSDRGCSDQYAAAAPWPGRDPRETCSAVGSHCTAPRAAARLTARRRRPARRRASVPDGRARATCQATRAPPITAVARHMSPEPARSWPPAARESPAKARSPGRRRNDSSAASTQGIHDAPA